ncbi:Tat (twin-arginine translocation) pathway signal sequence [Catalinimonas alkaloidigena]|uniref:Tat (Twin-arginine translocation) pathway signal sequence n=1 Tax=Catalinimonas alkaloidigena TaxID=1075417 RepID=A0A1G9UHI5_9BACT|nr:SGNH/GDSL hydrolase family protein [Catalinimonas alkaloidigena]SDM59356.1 Tat (twin-arginine translocation) pathway signal sequence [Catalinimonas alkaloidigena]
MIEPTSRREFLQRVGLTGLAAMAAPGLLAAAPQPLPPSQAPKKGITLLFQGDSITDGNRTRDQDWNHVMGHGYAYLIASRLWYDYPQEGLMFYNRGISGNKVSDLEARWEEDALALKPDLISILVGINDVYFIVEGTLKQSIAQFEATYRQMLERTQTALPEVTLVLCEPFLLPLGRVNKKTAVWEKETAQRQQVTRTLADEFGAVFVPLQAPFQEALQQAPADYWIWDGIHPMPAGHELIARQWLRTVGEKLPFLRK